MSLLTAAIVKKGSYSGHNLLYFSEKCPKAKLKLF